MRAVGSTCKKLMPVLAAQMMRGVEDVKEETEGEIRESTQSSDLSTMAITIAEVLDWCQSLLLGTLGHTLF